MQDFTKQFDALIAEGRVWYKAGPFSVLYYFPFLFSVGGSFIGKGLSGDEFRSWYRWKYRIEEGKNPPEAEVELASSRANGEFFTLRQLGLFVPVMASGSASSWAFFLPLPEVLRGFLLTSEEMETEWEDFKTYCGCPLPPEAESNVRKMTINKITPETVEAFRRCYQVADDLRGRWNELHPDD